MLPASVRHLHSSEWRAAGAKQKIRIYFEALGLPRDLATNPIAERLHAHFADELAQFKEVVAERANGFDRGDIYQLKNVSLEFSLLTGAAFRGPVHQTVMRWVAERHYSPATILDVGCDNGILTCFYALLWPTATVMGIDISLAGVSRAQELAASLELTNVRFLTKSIEEFATPEKNSQFDLVLTTTVLHEAGYFAPMESNHWFLDEAFPAGQCKSASPVFSIVAGLLSISGGRWLGAEGLATPHLLWRWVGALQAAGLHLERDSCARLKHDDELMSVLVAGRNVSEPATPAWATEFWVRKKLRAFGPKTRLPIQIPDLEAQFVFDSIPAKRRVAIACKWSNESSLAGREWERIEIWLTDTLAILYRIHANMGLEIYISGINQLDIVRENWELIGERYKESGCKFERRIDL